MLKRLNLARGETIEVKIRGLEHSHGAATERAGATGSACK